MRLLRVLDAIGAWGLIALGCVHNFYAAPTMFHALSDDLFWFVGAGLALWYAGAMNLARQASPAPIVKISALLVNLTLLGFVLVFGAHTGAIGRPDGWLLIGLAAVETVFSLGNLKAKLPGA